MDYDKILKMINKLELNKGETCMICHFPIQTNDTKSKLLCNHEYHYNCIKSYVSHDKIKCPYCSKKSKFNKLPEIITTCNTCNTILKYGKNKGNKCGKTNCKRHKKIDAKCYIILKSGKRKGEQCSRNNCNYHKKTITI